MIYFTWLLWVMGFRVWWELGSGLLADVVFFGGLTVKIPFRVDKLLYQWMLSLIRISIYIILAPYSVQAFTISLSIDSHAVGVIATEIMLNLIISLYFGGFLSKSGTGVFPKQQNTNILRRKTSFMHIVILILLLPLSEEIFFRCLLFNRWIPLIGTIPALLLQSGWFLVNHTPFVWARCYRSLSYAFTFYFSGGSLMASWLCHVANNIVAYSLDQSK